MNGSLEALNQKISLIYEYNNKSPLFARLAGIEIEKNNLDSAIDILTEGLKNYPEFSVAYFLLGKIHTLKGNYSQALSFIKKGSELIHSPKSFDYYFNEIDEIKKQRSFLIFPDGRNMETIIIPPILIPINQKLSYYY